VFVVFVDKKRIGRPPAPRPCGAAAPLMDGQLAGILIYKVPQAKILGASRGRAAARECGIAKWALLLR
jgi:hypothetical protein